MLGVVSEKSCRPQATAVVIRGIQLAGRRLLAGVLLRLGEPAPAHSVSLKIDSCQSAAPYAH
eukprot:5534995-Alexandrium_andersonii.AAC.1